MSSANSRSSVSDSNGKSSAAGWTRRCARQFKSCCAVEGGPSCTVAGSRCIPSALVSIEVVLLLSPRAFFPGGARGARVAERGVVASSVSAITDRPAAIAAGFGLLKQRRPCLFAGIVSAGCDRRPTCDARTYERHHHTHLLERDTELVQRCG